MSYCYHAIAVKSGATSVCASLEAFAQALGGFTRTLPVADFRANSTIFLLHQYEDWTVLASAGPNLMPALAVQLSFDTRAEVFCLAKYDAVGFEHFSLLHAGKLVHLFTRSDQGVEIQGIDPTDFVTRIQPDQFQLPAGDDPAGAGFEHSAFGIFCLFVAPFDLEEYIQERWDEACSLGCMSITIPNDYRYLLGATDVSSFSWQTLLARSRPDPRG